jgi:hypothetical protein
MKRWKPKKAIRELSQQWLVMWDVSEWGMREVKRKLCNNSELCFGENDIKIAVFYSSFLLSSSAFICYFSCFFSVVFCRFFLSLEQQLFSSCSNCHEVNKKKSSFQCYSVVWFCFYKLISLTGLNLWYHERRQMLWNRKKWKCEYDDVGCWRKRWVKWVNLILNLTWNFFKSKKEMKELSFYVKVIETPKSQRNHIDESRNENGKKKKRFIVECLWNNFVRISLRKRVSEWVKENTQKFRSK